MYSQVTTPPTPSSDGVSKRPLRRGAYGTVTVLLTYTRQLATASAYHNAQAIHKEARAGARQAAATAIAASPSRRGRREAPCIAPKHMMNTDAD